MDRPRLSASGPILLAAVLATSWALSMRVRSTSDAPPAGASHIVRVYDVRDLMAMDRAFADVIRPLSGGRRPPQQEYVHDLEALAQRLRGKSITSPIGIGLFNPIVDDGDPVEAVPELPLWATPGSDPRAIVLDGRLFLTTDAAGHAKVREVLAALRAVGR